jgi:hypothetical protein
MDGKDVGKNAPLWFIRHVALHGEQIITYTDAHLKCARGTMTKVAYCVVGEERGCGGCVYWVVVWGKGTLSACSYGSGNSLPRQHLV